MITKTYFRDILTVIGLSVVLTIFITHPGFSQDTTKTKGDKKVKIVAKIVTDNNGNRKEFDTTINLNRELKPGEEQEMMKNFQSKFRDLGEQMKELEMEMSEMKLPDSALMDSAQGLANKMFMFRGGSGNSHFRHHSSPKAFDYDFNFEMPELPDMPQPLIEEFSNDDAPGMPEEHQDMFRGNGQSLNDLLGDIPMDRVKSYSIKDTKDGKKIVIELNREPFIQDHRKVIILRSPRPEGRHYQGRGQGQPRIQKRIIIHQDDQNGEQKGDKL